MKGKPAWNKGLTKETSPILAEKADRAIGKRVGIPSPMKGIPSGKKGLTYEEIYGPEKGAKLKENRRKKKLEYWDDYRMRHPDGRS